MPKFSSLGISTGNGFKGSYVAILLLIDRKVVINVERYDVRPSRMHESRLCMVQLTISGRPIVTWCGSENLINIFTQATEKEGQGEQCFPFEECIFTRGEDGGYYIQDADDSCFRPTAEQVDDLIDESRHRNSYNARRCGR